MYSDPSLLTSVAFVSRFSTSLGKTPGSRDAGGGNAGIKKKLSAGFSESPPTPPAESASPAAPAAACGTPPSPATPPPLASAPAAAASPSPATFSLPPAPLDEGFPWPSATVLPQPSSTSSRNL